MLGDLAETPKDPQISKNIGSELISEHVTHLRKNTIEGFSWKRETNDRHDAWLSVIEVAKMECCYFVIRFSLLLGKGHAGCHSKHEG